MFILKQISLTEVRTVLIKNRNKTYIEGYQKQIFIDEI